MSQTPITYEAAEHQLQIFFDEALQGALSELREAQTAPLLDELSRLRTDILKLRRLEPDQAHREITGRIEHTLSQLNLTVQSRHITDSAAEWKKLVLDAVQSVDENLTCFQSEERFIPQPDDIHIIQLKKRAKQAGRAAGRIFKSDRQWTQQIPFRQLLIFRLLSAQTIFRDTLCHEAGQLSRVLVLLLNKPLPKQQPFADEPQPVQDTAEAAPPTTQDKIEITGGLFGDQAVDHISRAIETIKSWRAGGYASNPALAAAREDLRTRLPKAGTTELPARRIIRASASKHVEAATSTTIKALEKWRTYLKSQLNDLQVEFELASFHLELTRASDLLLSETHTFFRDTCYIPTEHGVETLTELINTLQQEKKERKVKPLIEDARNRLQSEFIDVSLATMQNQELQRKLINEIQKTISDLELHINRFSETLHLAESRTFRMPLPELSSDTLKWRSIASRFIKNHALKPIRPETQNFSAFILEQASEIEEASGIVDANLQAAVTSEKLEGEESPTEIAVSGLKRAVQTLEKSIISIREKQNTYETLIREELPKAFERLSSLMRERRYDEFELHDKALLAKETALGWRERFIRYYAVTEDRLELAWRYGRGRFFTIYTPLARSLGFSAGTVGSARVRLNLTEYLLQHQNRDEKLPFIYQRLFRRSFQIDRRFYLDATSNLAHFTNGYQQWSKGIPWSLVVTGQKGSGKSTLLNFCKLDETLKHDVVHIKLEQTIYDPAAMNRLIAKSIGFTDTEDTAELIAKIQRSRKKRILIFEGLQNLYIRNVRGYDAIGNFWVLLSQTTGQLFWVVSCSGNAWSFFCKMFSADQYFSHILRTDQLSGEQIEQGILLRHRATGYELTFNPSAEIQRSRAFRKLLGNEKEIQKYLQKEYFTRLSEAARGNFSIAMIFWINSIEKADESGIVIQPFSLADIDHLEAPSRDVLFTLAALIQHDVLTPSELAFAMHSRHSEASLLLGRLAAKGLVIQTNRGYTVNHLVYRQVSRMLSGRNILH